MRIGFVPLIDAAPLIVAETCGFFHAESLDVRLVRQVGWANVRDKLAYGHLDASHALIGLPLSAQIAPGSGRPLVAVMALGAGGNAITLSNDLYQAGVRTAQDLAAYVRRFGTGRPITLGHVFASSMHHYLLRDYLASAGLDPDRDVRLVVIPPPQMPQHIAAGHIDGFCVGEPWNTVAHRGNCGHVVLATTEMFPSHPEKVLAVGAEMAQQQPDVLAALIRALLNACAWIQDPAHHGEVAHILARPEYIDHPADVLLECLVPQRSLSGRRVIAPMQSFAAEHTFPSKTAMVWLLEQMRRWGHLSPAADIALIAARACCSDPYRRAVGSLGLACPPTDYPPLLMRDGSAFTVAPPESAIVSNPSKQEIPINVA